MFPPKISFEVFSIQIIWIPFVEIPLHGLILPFFFWEETESTVVFLF